MQLLVTFAFVLTLMYAHVVGALDHEPTWAQIIALPICIFLPMLVTLVLAKRTLRHRTQQADWQEIYRTRHRIERAHILLWIVGEFIVYGPLEWIELVRLYAPAEASFLIDEILILLPLFVASMAVLLVSNWYERKLFSILSGNTIVAGIDWKALQLQFGYVYVLPLIPVFFVIVINDLSIQFAPIATYGPYVCLPLLFGLLVCLPYVLRFMWDVQDFPNDDLGDGIRSVLQKSNIRVSNVFLWHSNCRLVNAAVTGIVPWARILLISDGLIQRLSKDEVNAIVAHEAAHIRHQHLLLNVVSVGLPLGMSILMLRVFQDMGIDGSRLLECSSTAFVFLCWLVFQRMLSRLLEYHADIVACRILDNSSGGMISLNAVQLFCRSLEKMAMTNESRDWWHPSVASRQNLLTEGASGSSVLTEVDKRFEIVSRLTCGAVVLLTLVNVGLSLIG